MRIVLEPVDEIPRGANGKFSAVICRIPSEERLFLSNRSVAMSTVRVGDLGEAARHG
jgi:hypothetical protein